MDIFNIYLLGVIINTFILMFLTALTTLEVKVYGTPLSKTKVFIASILFILGSFITYILLLYYGKDR